jgi:hypothetical protein
MHIIFPMAHYKLYSDDQYGSQGNDNTWESLSAPSLDEGGDDHDDDSVRALDLEDIFHDDEDDEDEGDDDDCIPLPLAQRLLSNNSDTTAVMKLSSLIPGLEAKVL